MSSILKIRDSFKKLKQVNTVTETLDIDGIIFEITVLTRQEDIDAQAWADQNTDGLSHVLRMDVSRLSFAIKKIDGIDMDEYVEDPDTGDKIQRNLFLRQELLNMPSPLLDALIHKHNVARSKLREKLGMQKVSLETLFEQAMSVQESAKELQKTAQESNQLAEIVDGNLELVNNGVSL